MDRGLEGFRTPMDASRGLERRSVPCGRFPSLFAASVSRSDEFSAPLMTTGLSAGSSRMLLRLSGQGRPVAGVKIVAGA
jgi:hypothetical protein